MNTAQHIHRRKERQMADLSENYSEVCSDQSRPDAVEVDSASNLTDFESTPPIQVSTLNIFGLVEVLLKNLSGLHRVLRTRQAHASLLPRLLTIALVGFVLYGVTMSLVLTVADRWPTLTPFATWLKAPQSQLVSIGSINSPLGKFAPWLSGRTFVLTAAYAFGLIAASGVALPSLYFYGLLAGVRLSMVDVLLHAVKAKAVAAVALIGILPIYVAVAMGVVIFNVPEYYLDLAIVLGLLLPFIAGLWGTASLYQGFSQLCTPTEDACPSDRECFLRRLVLSWSACYSAIMPIMIYTLWATFSQT